MSQARRELRAEGLGTITNRLVYIRNADGAIIRTDSYYRFEPAAPAQEAPPQPVYCWTFKAAPKAVHADVEEGRLF